MEDADGRGIAAFHPADKAADSVAGACHRIGRGGRGDVAGDDPPDEPADIVRTRDRSSRGGARYRSGDNAAHQTAHLLTAKPRPGSHHRDVCGRVGDDHVGAVDCSGIADQPAGVGIAVFAAIGAVGDVAAGCGPTGVGAVYAATPYRASEQADIVEPGDRAVGDGEVAYALRPHLTDEAQVGGVLVERKASDGLVIRVEASGEVWDVEIGRESDTVSGCWSELECQVCPVGKSKVVAQVLHRRQLVSPGISGTKVGRCRRAAAQAVQSAAVEPGVELALRAAGESVVEQATNGDHVVADRAGDRGTGARARGGEAMQLDGVDVVVRVGDGRARGEEADQTAVVTLGGDRARTTSAAVVGIGDGCARVGTADEAADIVAAAHRAGGIGEGGAEIAGRHRERGRCVAQRGVVGKSLGVRRARAIANLAVGPADQAADKISCAGDAGVGVGADHCTAIDLADEAADVAVSATHGTAGVAGIGDGVAGAILVTDQAADVAAVSVGGGDGAGGARGCHAAV